jgi:hypothetical protein
MFSMVLSFDDSKSHAGFRLTIFDGLVKSPITKVLVIPANPGSGPGQAPESSYFKMFWTPAFAGVTIQGIFLRDHQS